MQSQAEPGRYLAVALGIENLHVRGALAAPAGGAAAHVYLVKIFRLHRDRNDRQRWLPPDEVRGRLDHPDPLAAHEGRRAKQPGFIQFDRPVHPLALGGGLGAVARVADVHRAGSLGGDAHLHADVVNTRLGRKLQLRLDRLGLLRPGVGCARGGRQEKAKLTPLGLSAAIRLVGDLFAVADAVHDLPVGGAQFYFAALFGQPKTRVQCRWQKSQPGDQAHVGAAPAGVQARDGQHVFALSQQVHMGREVEPIRRAGLASLRGHAVRVQFFAGGVHRRDACAVQVGDKAVVKIHLQHQRLRQQPFRQLKRVPRQNQRGADRQLGGVVIIAVAKARLAKRKLAVVKLHRRPVIGQFTPAGWHKVFPLGIGRDERRLKWQRRRGCAERLGGEGHAILPGHPDELIAARLDGDVGQRPSAWLVAAARELKLGQAQHLVAGVVKLQPVAAGAGVIQRAAPVGGEQLVDPERMRLGMHGDHPGQQQGNSDSMKHETDKRGETLAESPYPSKTNPAWPSARVSAVRHLTATEALLER